MARDRSMVISRTPYRISFVGGGTDYPSWYRQFGGKVLSTTINRYVYVSCRRLPPFFDHRLRLAYSKIEEVAEVADLKHPTAREVLRYQNINDGLEIHYDGDLPARSGLGSSSAFTVGLLNAVNALQEHEITPRDLARNSTEIEQDIVGECVGSQDQISASYGGLNLIDFRKTGEILVRPAAIDRDRQKNLEENLMLFFTGFPRTASEVAATYVAELPKAHEKRMRRIQDLVDQAMTILGTTTSLDDFGKLLDEMWQEKRGLSGSVSNRSIDLIYDKGLGAGALGGKLLGAGGGGMILFYVPKKMQESVKRSLGDLVHVPFKFEPLGSRIIYLE